MKPLPMRQPPLCPWLSLHRWKRKHTAIRMTIQTKDAAAGCATAGVALKDSIDYNSFPPIDESLLCEAEKLTIAMYRHPHTKTILSMPTTGSGILSGGPRRHSARRQIAARARDITPQIRKRMSSKSDYLLLLGHLPLSGRTVYVLHALRTFIPFTKLVRIFTCLFLSHILFLLILFDFMLFSVLHYSYISIPTCSSHFLLYYFFSLSSIHPSPQSLVYTYQQTILIYPAPILLLLSTCTSTTIERERCGYQTPECFVFLSSIICTRPMTIPTCLITNLIIWRV